MEIENREKWLENKIVKERLKEVWMNEGEYFQACFDEIIIVLQQHKKKYGLEIFEDSRFITRRYKDMIGAHGIGKTAINIGMISEKALVNKSKKIRPVKDHVFGYITIARTIINAFLKSDLFNDKNWLEKYLHLWVIIHVTKEEHHRENIKRSNQLSNANLDYKTKKKMNHYTKVSRLLLDKNYKYRQTNMEYKKKVIARVK